MCQSPGHGPGLYYLTPAHSFYVMPTFERCAADHSNEERILSCYDTSQEGLGRYRFESSNKEDELVQSLVRP